MRDTALPGRTSVRSRTIWVLTILLCLSWPLSLVFQDAGLAATDGSAVGSLATFNLFAHQDTWMGPALAVLIAAVMTLRWREVPGQWMARRDAVALAALGSVLLVVLLRYVMHRNYGLALDEFMPTFQAEIFRQGELMAPMSDATFADRHALQPFFTYVDETRQLWMQHYRPVHAALLSLFPASYAVAAVHGALTGVTLLAMADIARRLFPDRPGAPFLAVGLLIASPQFLLTAASGFAFTTHLAFNTVWLALFLRGSWPAHVAAALIGFVALGIHQVHVHAIQVLPFGLAMLLGYFGSRWKAVPYVLAYAVGVPLWIAWPEVATWLQTGDASVLPRGLFETEYLTNFLARSAGIGAAEHSLSGLFLLVNLWRFALWLSPALLVLLALAVPGLHRLGHVAVIAALGVLFTVALSHVLLPNQMYTIGSRYYHTTLANLVIVGLGAFYALAGAHQRRATLVLMAVSLAVLLPWRAVQVHEKVAPRAALQARLEQLETDRVILTGSAAWFIPDFVRNDPYLRNRPVFSYDARETGTDPLDPADRRRLGGEDLFRMGLPRGTFLEPDRR